jgi:hypothetical protein
VDFDVQLECLHRVLVDLDQGQVPEARLMQPDGLPAGASADLDRRELALSRHRIGTRGIVRAGHVPSLQPYSGRHILQSAITEGDRPH